VSFNESEPVSISTTTGSKTETANVLGAYGPTIVNGAMVYFVDNVFSNFVVANLATVLEDSARTIRRSRPRPIDRTFSLTEAELAQLDFDSTTNPLSPSFQGCFFYPNDDQLVNLASFLFPAADISTNSTLPAIADLIAGALNDDKIKEAVKCAIAQFAVAAPALSGTALNAKCDNVAGRVADLKTECGDALQTIDVDGLTPPSASNITSTNPNRRRSLLAFPQVGALEGESAGASVKSTFFYQDSPDFVASPGVAALLSGALQPKGAAPAGAAPFGPGHRPQCALRAQPVIPL